MKRFFAAIAGLYLIATSVSAFYQSRDSNYNISVSSGAAYVGPGDVVASANGWWGLRAYSAAKAGNKAVRLVRASDSTQSDINTLANGNLDVSTATTFCNATTCKVVTLYDQTGNTNCIGPIACDLTQATDASRPAFTFSCLGSLPCMAWAGGQKLTSSAGLISSVSQPYTFNSVAKRTSGTTYSDIISDGPENIYLEFKGANTVVLSAGGEVSATANDNTTHAIQAIFNGGASASTFFIDGTSTAVSTGTTAFNGAPTVGGAAGGDFLTGISTEYGFWPSGFSAGNQSSMNNNQHTYWGF